MDMLRRDTRRSGGWHHKASRYPSGHTPMGWIWWVLGLGCGGLVLLALERIMELTGDPADCDDQDGAFVAELMETNCHDEPRTAKKFCRCSRN
jgi:hypothetical protein